ncbi:MAG: serine hydrolase [Mangrovibacterium sp.]
MKQILILAVLLNLVTSSFGQDSRQDKRLAKYVDNIISEKFEDSTPGCAVLVAKNGKIILEKGYGIANLELNASVKPEMVFRIGSITKQFTAVAILQLIEKGELSLNDSIQRVIPNFNTRGKIITIENLLTHTSGIIGYERFDSKIPNAMRVEFKPEVIIDSLNGFSLEFEPNTKFNYSNSNYFLLGYMIEKITGKSYQQYLRENIIEPAGLSTTYYDSQTKIIPNRASGYSYWDGAYHNSEFISMSLAYSAGAMISSVGDLFKWHQALYANKLLKKETLDRALTPYRLADGSKIAYGYGFFIIQEEEFKSIGHGGAIDGFKAGETYFPEEDIFIAVLCNTEREQSEQMINIIEDAVLNNNITKTKGKVVLSESTLDSYVGTYTNEEYGESLYVYKENGRLYGDLSNGTGRHMVFKPLSKTKFLLPQIIRIRTTCDFILEDNNVTKIIFYQEKANEFIRK